MKFPMFKSFFLSEIMTFRGKLFYFSWTTVPPTLPIAAVRYPALLAMLARLVSFLGSPARPPAEMITGGVWASPVVGGHSSSLGIEKI